MLFFFSPHFRRLIILMIDADMLRCFIFCCHVAPLRRFRRRRHYDAMLPMLFS